MKLINLNSISNKLYLLIIIAVLPALVILLYSSIEQRREGIENAKRNVRQLVHIIAENQKEVTNSTKQVLLTLSRLSAIKNMDSKASNEILREVIKQNTTYNNMALVGLNGDVLASGRKFIKTNLADRKHVKGALKYKKFVIGEYIISRVGVEAPVFAFAHPVLNKDGILKGVLTAVMKLSSFSNFHDFANLPEQSFVALTDHKGIRLSYYPAQQKTNPIGKPVKAKNWEMVNKAQKAGIFIGAGSDGMRRIFAFEAVQLDTGDAPYLYAWAAIPEEHVLASVRSILTRNLLFMIMATVASLFFARMVGKRTIIHPTQNLVTLAQKFAKGELEYRVEMPDTTGELGVLSKAFHDMAQNLRQNQKTLKENESRFRSLMNSLNSVVYVADMKTYKILFINEHGKKLFGNISGKICWQSLQREQKKPCDFCTNKYLLGEDGNPGDVYTWEFRNTITGKWFHIQDRAIIWSDGCIVRLEIATDITYRKENELIKDALIEKLENALSEIKTLRGILPICSMCKDIRNDEGYYEQIEAYIHKHSGVDFSHTICPACIKKHYPQEYESIINENNKG